MCFYTCVGRAAKTESKTAEAASHAKPKAKTSGGGYASDPYATGIYGQDPLNPLDPMNNLDPLSPFYGGSHLGGFDAGLGGGFGL